MIRTTATSRTRRHRLGAVAVATVGLATLAACGGEQTTAVVIPNVFELSHDPTAAIAEPTPGRVDVMSADRLRNQLEKDLTWHSITLTQVMRHAHDGDPNVQAWIEELTGNTDDITAAIGLVYGPETARAFNQQWAQHTQFLTDYASAIASGDDVAADRAREHLEIYARDNGSFFAEATNQALPADAVTTLLQSHVTHMIDMIDAVDGGDDRAALQLALDDNEYLATIAQALATALAGNDTAAFPGPIETPEALYCSIITTKTGNYLLSELFVPADGAASAATFEQATGVPLIDVIGVIDQLQSPDQTLAAQTADLALDRAFEHARPSAP